MKTALEKHDIHIRERLTGQVLGEGKRTKNLLDIG